MKRRDFIKLGAGLGAAVTLSSPLPARAQAKAVFKAADVHPTGYPTVAATENLGKKLAEATNGRLSVQMYPSAQLGAEKETIEQAHIGPSIIFCASAPAPSARSSTTSMSSTCRSCSRTPPTRRK